MEFEKSPASSYYKCNDSPEGYSSNTCERVSESSTEFDEVLSHFLGTHSYVSDIWKIQDLPRQELYLLKQQYLSILNRDIQYYSIKHFVVVPYYLVDHALSTNLNHRRCNFDFEFWSSVPSVRNSAVFVVNVITDNIYSTLFEPFRQDEYYIEYVVYVE